MTVRTFYLPGIEGSGQDYKAIFEQSFDKLLKSNSPHLILDLSNNHRGTIPLLFDHEVVKALGEKKSGYNLVYPLCI